MNKKESILLLGDANSYHIHKWMIGIAKHYQVVVFSSDQLEEKYRYLYTDNNIILSDGDGKVSNSRSISAYTKPIKRLKEIYKQYNPVITHAHYATSYGYLGALLNPKNYLISTWGTDVYDFPTRTFLHRLFFKWILSKADTIFATSKDLKKHTSFYTNKEIIIIPYGIDTQKFVPSKSDTTDNTTFVIGTVKGLNRVYGIDRLIDAFAKFNVKIPNSRLEVYGKGIHEEELKGHAEQYNLPDKILFKGFIENKSVPAVIQNMDVFCALSRSESFGVAVIEASACEKPVLVSNIGGLVEVVKHNETGIIVDAENIDQVVEALLRLYEDRDFAKQLGQQGRKFVLENFSWEENLQQQLNFYQQLIEKNSK